VVAVAVAVIMAVAQAVAMVAAQAAWPEQTTALTLVEVVAPSREVAALALALPTPRRAALGKEETKQEQVAAGQLAVVVVDTTAEDLAEH